MGFVLFILLIVAAIGVASVFTFFFVIAKIVRALLWVLGIPIRAAAAAGRPQRANPVLLRATPVERRCANPKCGADMVVEARFCGRCGSAVTAGSMLYHEPLPDATYLSRRAWKKKYRKGDWRIVDGVLVRPTVIPPRRQRVSRVA